MTPRRFSRRRTILVLDGDGVFVHEIHALLSLRCTILLAANVQELEPMLGSPHEEGEMARPAVLATGEASPAKDRGGMGPVEKLHLMILDDPRREPSEGQAERGRVFDEFIERTLQVRPSLPILVATHCASRVVRLEQRFDNVVALLRPFDVATFRAAVESCLHHDTERA